MNIMCQVMADIIKVYDDLIIINLYNMGIIFFWLYAPFSNALRVTLLDKMTYKQT